MGTPDWASMRDIDKDLSSGMHGIGLRIRCHVAFVSINVEQMPLDDISDDDTKSHDHSSFHPFPSCSFKDIALSFLVSFELPSSLFVTGQPSDHLSSSIIRALK
jgi:hypothetical protein